MINANYTQAKGIQQLAEKFLYQDTSKPYTDIEEWKEAQEHLNQSIEELISKEGMTPQEEGEIVLAILMGYTIAVRKRKNIAVAMKRATKVLPKLDDPVLKCRLTVFCYGECFDEELANMAHQLILELKEAGNKEEVVCIEELLLNIEESYQVV